MQCVRVSSYAAQFVDVCFRLPPSSVQARQASAASAHSARGRARPCAQSHCMEPRGEVNPNTACSRKHLCKAHMCPCLRRRLHTCPTTLPFTASPDIPPDIPSNHLTPKAPRRSGTYEKHPLVSQTVGDGVLCVQPPTRTLPPKASTVSNRKSQPPCRASPVVSVS